jgi:Holliday junction resolvasome RuvABC endonuclease subunit
LKETIKVLGLDGSLQNFGIAVGTVHIATKELVSVDQLVLSKTSKSTDKKLKRADDDFNRFREHWLTIETIIAMDKPLHVFGEIPSGAQDARAAFAFGGVTAILAGLSLTNNLITVTPAEVKLAATGWKHADKEDIIAAMHGLYPTANWIKSRKPNAMAIEKDGWYLTNANEHLADAVAIILAGIKKL